MRYRFPPVFAALLVLPVWYAASVAAWPLNQNDAGTGRDAPDSFHKGLKLPLGTYSGELVGIPFSQGIQHSQLDQDDWYRFWIKKDTKIRVLLEGQTSDHPVVNYQMLIRLVDPREELAGIEFTSFQDGVRNFSVVTQSTGWWGIHLWTAGGGGNYRFTISAEDPPAFHFAGTGGGLHVFAYRVYPGAQLLGLFKTFTIVEDLQPVDVQMFQVRLDDDQMTETMGFGGGAKAEVATDVQALDQTVHVTQPVKGRYAAGHTEGPLNALEPGVYAVVVILSGRESAVAMESRSVEGAVEFLGYRHRPIEDLLLLRHKDFKGTLGMSNSLVTVSRGLSAQVTIEHDLFGLYSCWTGPGARCSIIHPDNFTEQLTFAAAILDHPEPGVWTFTRDEETSVHPNQANHNYLVGADVDLTWARRAGGLSTGEESHGGPGVQTDAEG